MVRCGRLTLFFWEQKILPMKILNGSSEDRVHFAKFIFFQISKIISGTFWWRNYFFENRVSNFIFVKIIFFQETKILSGVFFSETVFRIDYFFENRKLFQGRFFENRNLFLSNLFFLEQKISSEGIEGIQLYFCQNYFF